MSIAEKLTTIAENMQRIFDAGYQKGINASGGGGDENTITFYVNGSPLTAEAGMTWGDFVESRYNPTFRYEDCCDVEVSHFGTPYNAEGDIYYTSSCCGPIEGIVVNAGGGAVWVDEQIESGYQYTLQNEF